MKLVPRDYQQEAAEFLHKGKRRGLGDSYA